MAVPVPVPVIRIINRALDVTLLALARRVLAREADLPLGAVDLDDDGVCDAISIVFEFDGVEAFFYEE